MLYKLYGKLNCMRWNKWLDFLHPGNLVAKKVRGKSSQNKHGMIKRDLDIKIKFVCAHHQVSTYLVGGIGAH